MSEVLRGLPPTPFDFSGLAASTTMTLYLAQRIPAAEIDEADVLLRLHSATITTPASQSLGFYLVPDANTEDDPANLFMSPTSLALANYVTPSTAITTPMLQVLAASIASSGKAFGRYLALILVATQGVAQPLKATISFDVARKGRGASGSLARGYLGYAF